MIYYGNHLAHHGILGQKWGIRRYQNENGSLTKEGKWRYREEKYNQYLSEEKNDGFFARSRAKNKAKVATKLVNQNGEVDVRLDKKLNKLSEDIKMARTNGDGKTANKLSKKWIENRYRQLYAHDFVKNIDKRTDEYISDMKTMTVAGIGFGMIGVTGSAIALELAKSYDERDYRKGLKDQARSEYMKKFGNSNKSTSKSEQLRNKIDNAKTKKERNAAIDDMVKHARKTGMYDMEFLERNLDINPDTEKQYTGKAMDNAYRKYLYSVD